MSKETEKIMKELEKFMKNKNIESDKDCEDNISDFISIYNKKQESKKGKNAETSWDYLEMANQAENREDALKYAKKALKLDKNCLDAEVMIAELSSESMEQLRTKYNRLRTKAEEQLKKDGLFDEDNIGDFWLFMETRPYMRLRYSLIQLLIDAGKFKQAIIQCEDMLRLCTNDNMGVRYFLICLYAMFEDEFNVLKLHKQFENERSTHMLLAIVALYYKMDNYKKARKYLTDLRLANPEFDAFFMDEFDTDDFFDKVVDSGMYAYASKEEVAMALAEGAFLYESMNDFMFWVFEEISK